MPRQRAASVVTSHGCVGYVCCFSALPAATVLYGTRGERVVAVASDGGDVCFTSDDRARVDTKAAQDWIRQTIADAVGGLGRQD